MLQEEQPFPLDISIIKTETEMNDIPISIKSGDRIFFSGDLGSGKSTCIRAILRKYFQNPNLVVRSPTYTYFQKYGDNIYHFDLYRLESLEDFFLIGGNDILEDPTNICLIEWPEIISPIQYPTCNVSLEILSDTTRKITIHRSVSATE